MTIQSPRVGLMLAGDDGWPAIPQFATIPGGPTVPVWDEVFPGQTASFPSREYRLSTTPPRLIMLVRLATCVLPDSRAAALILAWVPAGSRLAQNTTYDQLTATPDIAPRIVATWPVISDGDALTLPMLDADTTPLGLLAQSVWPANWRVRLPTDDNGDPMHGVPAAPPTGPRAIMEVIAG